MVPGVTAASRRGAQLRFPVPRVAGSFRLLADSYAVSDCANELLQ